MLVARRFWPELRELRGDRGAQPVAYRHPDEVVSVPFPEGACDIDTREDYEALLKADSAPFPMNMKSPGEAALPITH
jgi:CTP:molybdopterin cytidylyltransferase MocA